MWLCSLGSESNDFLFFHFQLLFIFNHPTLRILEIFMQLVDELQFSVIIIIIIIPSQKVMLTYLAGCAGCQ